MNQQAIGKFIAQMRKEKEMTQKQLAERIGVSDKAVSRWETGKGLPDTSIMPQLCQALDININELLSGERLSEVMYNGKAEENMVYLMKVSEDKKRKEKSVIAGTVAGMLFLVLIICFLIIYSGGGRQAFLDFLDYPSVLLNLIAGGAIIGIGGQMKPFIRSFKYAFKTQTEEEQENVKQSYFAVQYAMKTFLYVGSISLVISVVIITSRYYSNPEILGKSFAVAMLTLFYALLFDIFLLPISAKLKTKIS